MERETFRTSLYPSGASIHFTYDDKSRIIRAEAGKDSWATYEYNSDGMLSEVRRSNGHSSAALHMKEC